MIMIGCRNDDLDSLTFLHVNRVRSELIFCGGYMNFMAPEVPAVSWLRACDGMTNKTVASDRIIAKRLNLFIGPWVSFSALVE